MNEKEPSRATLVFLFLSIALSVSFGISCRCSADSARPTVIPTDQVFFQKEWGMTPSLQLTGGIDAFVHESMERWAVPGVSIAVAQDGALVWAAAFGWKEAGSDEQLEVHTPMQAGSISKPIAASVALTLAAEGLVELDAPVSRYLGRLPLESHLDEGVTPRRLLSHTSGLALHGFSGYRRGDSLPSFEDILSGRQPANNEPLMAENAPGEGFGYSGGGYLLVEALITKVTGDAFDAVARDRILSPLEMEDSGFGGMPEGAAAGHRGDGVPIHGGPRVHPELAAAGLWTTAVDLTLFALELQRSRRAREPAGPLPPKLVQEMLTPVAEVSARDGGAANRKVGLGLFLTGDDEPRWFSHGGANAGYKAIVVGSLESERALAVMTNGDGGKEMIPEILVAVGEALGWDRFEELGGLW